MTDKMLSCKNCGAEVHTYFEDVWGLPCCSEDCRDFRNGSPVSIVEEEEWERELENGWFGVGA